LTRILVGMMDVPLKRKFLTILRNCFVFKFMFTIFFGLYLGLVCGIVVGIAFTAKTPIPPPEAPLDKTQISDRITP
jgi:MFS superfamily sulfate permease-like transporter